MEYPLHLYREFSFLMSVSENALRWPSCQEDLGTRHPLDPHHTLVSVVPGHDRLLSPGLGEGGSAVVHDGAGVVGGPHMADLVEVVLQEVVLHPTHDVVPVDLDIVIPADGNINLLNLTPIAITQSSPIQ